MATRFAGWLRILLVMIGGASLAGWLFARYVWLARGRLPATARRSRLEIDDGTSIALAHISQGRDHVVVLAHGFLKRKDDLRIIRLASSLLQQFDVILFDQPGHGDSTGLADMDIATAGDILARIAVEARRLGYVRVSAVGVSLGAAAAIHAASAGCAAGCRGQHLQPGGIALAKEWGMAYRTLEVLLPSTRDTGRR